MRYIGNTPKAPKSGRIRGRKRSFNQPLKGKQKELKAIRNLKTSISILPYQVIKISY